MTSARPKAKPLPLKAYRLFQDCFRDKYPQAVSCLVDQEEALFAFYDMPAAHWLHIRSTNVIEKVFATVRLRTDKTKGCGTRVETLSIGIQTRAGRATNLATAGCLAETEVGTRRSPFRGWRSSGG
jgi:hypothetical protein